MLLCSTHMLCLTQESWSAGDVCCTPWKPVYPFASLLAGLYISFSDADLFSCSKIGHLKISRCSKLLIHTETKSPMSTVNPKENLFYMDNFEMRFVSKCFVRRTFEFPDYETVPVPSSYRRSSCNGKHVVDE